MPRIVIFLFFLFSGVSGLWTSRSFGHLFLVASKDPHFTVDYGAVVNKIRTPLTLLLQSKMSYSRGDQWGAITLCTDAFRANPSNPEAAAWYSELKQTMKCLNDS